MAIITISRGRFSHGEEIAQSVAKTLGYTCESQEVIVDASQLFQVPEAKLSKIVHDAPSILEKIIHTHEKFLTFIQAAILEYVKNDNVVYHGYAGHLLLPDISHILKVRVVAEMEARIALLQKKRKISRNKALEFLEKEDRERNEWNHYVCKVDISNPLLYDMVLHIGKLSIQDASEIICMVARGDTFKATPQSKRDIHNLALCSHVKAALQDICYAEVTANEGTVHVTAKGQRLKKSGFANPTLKRQVGEKIREDLSKDILRIVRKIPDVKDVFCDIDLPYYY